MTHLLRDCKIVTVTCINYNALSFQLIMLCFAQQRDQARAEGFNRGDLDGLRLALPWQQHLTNTQMQGYYTHPRNGSRACAHVHTEKHIYYNYNRGTYMYTVWLEAFTWHLLSHHFLESGLQLLM